MSCSCGGACQSCRSGLNDDYGIDVGAIAREEAELALTPENFEKVLSGDVSPIIGIAENTAKRACKSGVVKKLTTPEVIATGVSILAGIITIAVWAGKRSNK